MTKLFRKFQNGFNEFCSMAEERHDLEESELTSNQDRCLCGRFSPLLWIAHSHHRLSEASHEVCIYIFELTPNSEIK